VISSATAGAREEVSRATVRRREADRTGPVGGAVGPAETSSLTSGALAGIVANNQERVE
jgi:hypothetical protein